MASEPCVLIPHRAALVCWSSFEKAKQYLNTLNTLNQARILDRLVHLGGRRALHVRCRDLFIPVTCYPPNVESLEMASAVQGQGYIRQPHHTPGVRLRNFLNHRYEVAAQSPYLGLKESERCQG